MKDLKELSWGFTKAAGERDFQLFINERAVGNMTDKVENYLLEVGAINGV
ncbi:hypothetical protein [Teredinibacter turnerae]|nr:hypothetical protein [Teredinibacter turnerae]